MRRLLFCLLVLAATASPALAHKLKVFATAQGPVIEGYVYLNGGARPAGVPVTVLAAGQEVAHLTTGADGTFRVTAAVRADHELVATIEGHRGSWTVRAAELPAALPPPEGAAAPAPPPAEPGNGAAAPAAPTGVESVVERAVARQVAPLRAEIQTWREETRWRDIVGGLGWIVGLAGLAAWVSARKRPR